MDLIYHIAAAADWRRAQADGLYRIATRGQSLDEVGFIHAGTARQIAPVANAIYHDDQDLIVLVIDTDQVGHEIRYEQAPGCDERFPHIYGPLDVRAVIRTLPLEKDATGQFSFTPDPG